jgi:DNA-binding NarL/FixJ family response regulator
VVAIALDPERGQTVASEAQHPVVILYKHALLGEGIATYLRVQAGVEATVASAQDREAVTSALALGPAVVIFESSDPFQQFDLATLAPGTVLIDVSTVITRGSVLSPGVAGLEQILQAVRDCTTLAGPVGTPPVPAGLYRKSTVRRMGTPL